MSSDSQNHLADIFIQPVTIDDAESIAINHVYAFWTDPSWVLMWPGKTREYVTQQQTLRMPITLLDNPKTRRWEKAVDAEGRLVGHAWWTLPDSDPPSTFSGDARELDIQVPIETETTSIGVKGTTAPVAGHVDAIVAESVQHRPEAAQEYASVRSSLRADDMWTSARVPRVSDEKLQEFTKQRDTADWGYDRSMDEIEASMLEMRDRLLKERNYMVLDILAVAPVYRNRGIATQLVQSGLEQADALGLYVFLHAVQAGLGVYYRTGFELVDSMVLNDSRYGGTGDYGNYFLVRKPRVMPASKVEG